MTEEITRDTMKTNIRVLGIAAARMGLRAGVKTCQVHVAALYEYMQINCPRTLALNLRQFVITFMSQDM